MGFHFEYEVCVLCEPDHARVVFENRQEPVFILAGGRGGAPDICIEEAVDGPVLAALGIFIVEGAVEDLVLAVLRPGLG